MLFETPYMDPIWMGRVFHFTVFLNNLHGTETSKETVFKEDSYLWYITACMCGPVNMQASFPREYRFQAFASSESPVSVFVAISAPPLPGMPLFP